jgi:tRNA nucleotidyltransferase (CCA-adding enzyme)
MEIYEVGGCVRDEMLGIPSKDIDFSVVLTPSDFPAPGTAVTEPDPYNIMVRALEKDGNRIIRDKMGMPIGAEYMTVRAINPTRGAVDYVLARKDGEYGDGRRPDSVEIGTLYDDLARRDFTMNAIAKDSEGAYIDPFNGVQDIRDGVIRAVGEPWDRLTEDALRAVRAVRFAVTKRMRIDRSLEFAMESAAVLDALMTKIADERKREELNRMFAFDSLATIYTLANYPMLTNAIFAGSLSLEATMKQRGKQ